jgi:inorganic phosphate transporter, PiT family
MFFLFLSSGLFLGWSLGANDAGHVFGTAVGTRMVKFRTAAILFAIFATLGAVFSGTGTTTTLNALGGVDAMAGAFMVAFSAAFTIFWMTRLSLPISTTQAIVGSIIGWNLFTGSYTSPGTLGKILTSWVVCPVLSGAFAVLLYLAFRKFLKVKKYHLLMRDAWLRVGLILVGIFGSYSLGANNIANVVGVFINDSPFRDINLFGYFTFSAAQQLFLVGGIAISIGVFTYSKKVIDTVGRNLLKLSSEVALVVVLAQALVMFLFTSVKLEHLLVTAGLPSIPLVPVSSSQAVIGAIIGIGLLKSPREIQFNILGQISLGWIATPVMAGLFTFVSLFFLQNVFKQDIAKKHQYVINQEVILHLGTMSIIDDGLVKLLDKKYDNLKEIKADLNKTTYLNKNQKRQVIENAEIYNIKIDSVGFNGIEKDKNYSLVQKQSLEKLINQNFVYKWQFYEALEALSPEWKVKDICKANKIYNGNLESRKGYLVKLFRLEIK